MSGKLFNSFSGSSPRKNKFDLSHENKLSFNMGDLVPILVQEVIPGDSFRLNAEMILRVAPMLYPLMHKVHVFTNFFFVPERLIWDESQKFHTGGVDGNQEPIRPFTAFPSGIDNLHKVGTLSDYMGLPTHDDVANTVTNTTDITTLPFRAYQLIWNEYFRDQNVMAEVSISKASGNEAGTLHELMRMRKRSWEKDYFTSCLPWAQRGNPVLIPNSHLDQSKVFDASGNPAVAGTITSAADGGLLVTSPSGPNWPGNIDTMTATSVNDLRTSVRLQEFLEKLARGGSRYIEYLRNIWGKVSSDARLQRPEHLGGGVMPLVVSEVLSTYTNVTDSIPQGTFSGHGISVGSPGGFARNFEEHGFVIGLLSVLPTTGYQQGIERMWTRKDRFEYAIPDFAHIGEQEVMTNELYFDSKEVAPTNPVFGYQSRYAEYKYKQSTTHGDFRTSLSAFHANRIFGAKPVLNESFISADPTTRIFAVTAPDVLHMYADINLNFSALRPLPYFGIPGL
ncbi:MAG: major capsid protein [Microvirus sp.]|nr:MAG: major capsid protein [Microvirus sp.]